MPVPFESIPQEERLTIVDLLIAHLAVASSNAATAGNASLHAEIGEISGQLKTCREQISASDTAFANLAVSAALRLLSRLQSRSPGATASARTGFC